MFKIITICTLIFLLVSCGDSEDKPVSGKTNTLNLLVGTWFHDCWLDFTGKFHNSLEDRYSEDSTFTYIWTVYDGQDCSSSPIAQVLYKGKYQLHNPFEAEVTFVPNKNISAWQIDYEIEEVVLKGQKHIALATAGRRSPGSYYSIIAVDGDTKYDASMVDNADQRATQLNFDFNKVDAFIGLTPPIPGTVPQATVESDLFGDWNDGCFKNQAEDGSSNFYELVVLKMDVGNTIQFISSLWNDSICSGTEVASLTLSGTYQIVDSLITSTSQLPASIVEITLAPTVDYTGDQATADFNMPYADAAGDISYMIMYYDAGYDLVFYGGLLEAEVSQLPNDFAWAMPRI